GWATDQIIADIPMYYRGTETQIWNQSRKYSGDVNIQDAVAYSWNIPAITALQDVIDAIGKKTVAEKMASLGLEIFQEFVESNNYEDFKIGMAIGGADMYATPLEMAAAYGALANGGVYTEPYAITKIEFLDGSKEDYVHEVVSRQVFKPQSSYLMTQILVNAVSNYPGTYQSVMKSSYQVATKTGTSDWADDGEKWGIPTGSAKDKWTISYTSKYTIATWLGYDNDAVTGEPYGYLTNAQMNMNIPTKINKVMFDSVHKNNKPADFVQPSGIVEITHIKGAFDNGHYEVSEGTPSNMISTGKVLKEFATLKTLTPDPISELNTFTVTANPITKTLDFTFTPYPDSEALLEFDGKYHGVENFPDFNGRKIFSKTAVFGPIVYKVEVSQLGSSKTYMFSEDTGSISDLSITPGVAATVCGFYGYKNNDMNSNSVCHSLSAEDTLKLKEISIPEFPEHPEHPDHPDE
ncbi:MAG: penicillin-binding transpeptidase domain-containing protein, partial [Traorella sp.]